MYSITEIIARIREFKLNYKKFEDGPSAKIFHDIMVIIAIV